MSDESIALAQRERVFAEGERAFRDGTWRLSNPYSAGSSTLEQIWWNGWNQGRRRKQKAGSLPDDLTNHSSGNLKE